MIARAVLLAQLGLLWSDAAVGSASASSRVVVQPRSVPPPPPSRTALSQTHARYLPHPSVESGDRADGGSDDRRGSHARPVAGSFRTDASPLRHSPMPQAYPTVETTRSETPPVTNAESSSAGLDLVHKDGNSARDDDDDDNNSVEAMTLGDAAVDVPEHQQHFSRIGDVHSNTDAAVDDRYQRRSLQRHAPWQPDRQQDVLPAQTDIEAGSAQTDRTSISQSAFSHGAPTTTDSSTANDERPGQNEALHRISEVQRNSQPIPIRTVGTRTSGATSKRNRQDIHNRPRTTQTSLPPPPPATMRTAASSSAQTTLRSSPPGTMHSHSPISDRRTSSQSQQLLSDVSLSHATPRNDRFIGQAQQQSQPADHRRSLHQRHHAQTKTQQYQRGTRTMHPMPPQQHEQSRQKQQAQQSDRRSNGWMKGLWKQVERGLDGLSDFEDALTGRAVRLARFAPAQTATHSNQQHRQTEEDSTPAASSSGPQPRRTARLSASRTPSQKQHQRPTSAVATPSGTRGSAKMAKPDNGQAMLSLQDLGAFSSLTKKYDDAIAKKKADALNNSPSTIPVSMVHPVGGASDPNRSHPQPAQVSSSWQPASQQSPSNGPVPPINGETRQPNNGISEGNAQEQSTAGTTVNKGTQPTVLPVRGNPYLQQTAPKQMREKDSNKSVATQQRRASRIPWAEHASSSGSGRNRPSASRSALNGPYSFDADDEKTSVLSKIGTYIPRIPFPSRLFRRRSDPYAGMDLWDKDDSDDEDGSSKGGKLFGWTKQNKRKNARNGEGNESDHQSGWRNRFNPNDSMPAPLTSITNRCNGGNSTCLLSSDDRARAKVLGRRQATMDILCASLLLVGLKLLPDFSSIPFSLEWHASELTSHTVPALGRALADALLSWAPFVLVSAYFMNLSNVLWTRPGVHSLASRVAGTVENDSRYSQLYLRLVSATPLDLSLPGSIRAAAYAQVQSSVATSRLRTFVSYVVTLFVVTAMTVLRPAVVAILRAVSQAAALDAWRTWPVPWAELKEGIKEIFKTMFYKLKSTFAAGASAAVGHPLQLALFVIVLGALSILSAIPAAEEKRKIAPAVDEEYERSLPTSLESMDHLSKLGASSANRLSMLSEDGSVENVLERWRLSSTTEPEQDPELIGSVMRVAGLRLLCVVVAVTPLALYLLLNSSVGLAGNFLARQGVANQLSFAWKSILDLTVMLLFTLSLSWQAVGKAVISTVGRGPIMAFLTSLTNTVAEVSSNSNGNQADISLNASLSPTAGIVVRDFWAAHTSKRAWAVRGANFYCRNGEILVVLGDDGSGKTRLLTALAESIIAPPKQSLSSSKVRGSISIGGVDVNKWDRTMLKRRTGILLNDVRTAADTASVVSGLTLEEVLEPVDGLKTLDPARQLSAMEKSSMLLSMKVTGLYTSLLPKLPSKWSTVITANEEDLKPSSLRPRSVVLSPSEWSKLLLAKVLAQTIADNDNSAASNDKIDSSLVGSVLILDDPTVLLSEVEEAAVLNAIRRTGAATVLSTNKWATGRFADRVVVVKDGAIVESGTHNELLSAGPQRSLYAAKWQAMTSQ